MTFSARMTPQLFAAARSNSAAHDRAAGVLPEPARDAQHRSPDRSRTRASARPWPASIDYAGHRLGAQGLGGAGLRLHPAGPDRLLTEPRPTSRTSRQAKSLLSEAGYGSGGKKLSLLLTLANGDADEALVASVIKSDLAAVGVDVRVQRSSGRRSGRRASRSDPSKRQDIFLFYWYPDYADPYSWFVNLFRSANPPYFNLSYYTSKPVDASIDSLQQKTATNKTAGQRRLRRAAASSCSPTPWPSRCTSRTTSASIQKSMTGYVDNPAYANVVFVHDLRPVVT